MDIDNKIEEFYNFSKDRILMQWIGGAMGSWFYTFLIAENEFTIDPTINRCNNLEWNFNNSFHISNTTFTNADINSLQCLESFVDNKYPNITARERNILIRLLEVKLAVSTNYLNELKKSRIVFDFLQQQNIEDIDNIVLSSPVILNQWNHIKTHGNWPFFADSQTPWAKKINVAFPPEKRWIAKVLCFYKRIIQWTRQSEPEAHNMVKKYYNDLNPATGQREYNIEIECTDNFDYQTIDMYQLVFKRNIDVLFELFPNFKLCKNHDILLDLAYNDQMYILKMFDLDHNYNLNVNEGPEEVLKIMKNSFLMKEIKSRYRIED